MTFTSEINPATLLAIAVQFILIVVLLTRTMDRAAAAERDIKDLRKQHDAMVADIAAFKLESAKQFVTDDMLKQVEIRVVGAIDRLADRLDRIIETRATSRRKAGADEH